MARKTVQENIEDKTFNALIKRYTKQRNWPFLSTVMFVYGHVMEDRERDDHQQEGSVA
jgi:hypothetical protein